jgi:S1-C subfamily serine protease
VGGDIIQKVDGRKVERPQDLTEYIAAAHVGQQVKLQVVTAKGEKIVRTVRLGRRV